MTTSAARLTEAETISRAWDALERAEALPWPGGSYDVIADTADALRESLELHDLMTEYGLDRSPATAGCTQGVADDITDQARNLADVIRRHIGENEAAHIRGEGGGQR